MIELILDSLFPKHEDQWGEYWNNKPAEFELRDPSQKKVYKRRHEYLNSLIGTQKPKQILEVGCGSGYDSFLLQKKYDCEAWLLDKSQEAIHYSQRLAERIGTASNHKQWIHSDFFDANLPLESFDLVLSTGFLEHFEPHQRILALKKMHALLKNGGTCFVTVPNLCSLEIFYRMYREGRRGENPLSKETLKKEFLAVGFSPVRIRSANASVIPSFFPQKPPFIWMDGLKFLDYLTLVVAQKTTGNKNV